MLDSLVVRVTGYIKFSNDNVFLKQPVLVLCTIVMFINTGESVIGITGNEVVLFTKEATEAQAKSCLKLLSSNARKQTDDS